MTALVLGRSLTDVRSSRELVRSKKQEHIARFFSLAEGVGKRESQSLLLDPVWHLASPDEILATLKVVYEGMGFETGWGFSFWLWRIGGNQSSSRFVLRAIAIDRVTGGYKQSG